MYSTVRFSALIFLAIAMFFNPQEVILAAAAGISLWWQFVLPALLPFFILSELLMGSGIVHFVGVLLEPLMRPLFRLPGCASFVVAMGYTSGFPMGAVLTTRLRKQGELTREESERLIAFTNNPSPGFMFGAVASGMLKMPSLGIIIAASVYLANLIVGFLLRFYKPRATNKATGPKKSLKDAWLEMQRAQTQDGRPFGQILGDAVRQSVTTVIAVGGFIVFFAVLLRLLTVWHVIRLITLIFKAFFGPFISSQGLTSLINGFFEMTLGCQSATQSFPYLNQQIAVLSLIMGWGGLSVLAQVAGFSGGSDIRLAPYLGARLIHAPLAVFIGQILLRATKVSTSKASFNPAGNTAQLWLKTWQLSSEIGLAVLTCFLILAFLVWIRLKINK